MHSHLTKILQVIFMPKRNLDLRIQYVIILIMCNFFFI